MAREIIPIDPCEKCGFKMSVCSTDDSGYDLWGISKCLNPKCDNWKAADELIKMGNQMRNVQ